jgi:hypothetical protein
MDAIYHWLHIRHIYLTNFLFPLHSVRLQAPTSPLVVHRGHQSQFSSPEIAQNAVAPTPLWWDPSSGRCASQLSFISRLPSSPHDVRVEKSHRWPPETPHRRCCRRPKLNPPPRHRPVVLVSSRHLEVAQRTPCPPFVLSPSEPPHVGCLATARRRATIDALRGVTVSVERRAHAERLRAWATSVAMGWSRAGC